MADAVITQRRCRSCGGRYAVADAQGYRYYHACPPLSEPEVQCLDPDGRKGLKPGDERKNKRDENVRGGKTRDRHDARSDGDGVDEL